MHLGNRLPSFNLSVGMCVRVCDIEFVVFIDCSSCTRPISTKPVSMEVGGYGLTRGTFFFARRLEVVAFAGLLRLSWCVVGGGGFCRVFSGFFFRMHTACCECEAALRRLPLYCLRALPLTPRPPSPERLKYGSSGLVRLCQ